MHCALLHYRLRHHLACTAQAGESTGTTNIDPDGDGGVVAFNVRCDQDSNGGGWMLVATRRYDSNPKSAGECAQECRRPAQLLTFKPAEPPPTPNQRNDRNPPDLKPPGLMLLVTLLHNTLLHTAEGECA
jgi:hypothetical protein